jgi:DNA-binding NarL/FixJ family response regulator
VSEGEPIRVLVADDHAIVRTGIRHVLESEPGFVVVGEASTGAEALELAARLQPDVTVLDISMPGTSGLRVAAELRERAPETQVLILSMHDNTEYVLESLRAGVHGYLLKDTAATELRGAIRAVRRGESFFSPPIAGRLSAVVRGDPAATSSGALAQLTARERQVLVGVARGHTNREMAAQFGISPRTVESHRENLMKKLGVRTVAGLTRLALEAGLVRD